MECVTQCFQRVQQAIGPWLWHGPKIVSEGFVPSHADAKNLTQADREGYARRAAVSLNTVTQRADESDRWLPMRGGNDKAQKWTAKAYVNITNEDLEVQITGPLGTLDENTKVRVVVPAGHCLLSTITGQPGGKQHFARNFSSKKHGTKGVVFVGTIVYVPQQEAAPATLPSSQDSSASSQKPRTRSIVQREQLQDLNDAYLKLHDEPFGCLVELLDIKQAELDSVFAMKPAKRRKLQVAFNLLARCDG